jgi:hypothetical protein
MKFKFQLLTTRKIPNTSKQDGFEFIVHLKVLSRSYDASRLIARGELKVSTVHRGRYWRMKESNNK